MTPDELSVADGLLRLAIAFALALPLGWDRERRSRSAGLRTYPLLSACACGFLLLPQGLAWDVGGQADIVYAFVSGIGFVVGGAMLKAPDGARGVSTGVSLWVSGAIGAAAAYGAAPIAAALAVLSLVALRAPRALAARRR
jgi:putative Mg2+ transporter-C (MgtC) family protein